MSKTCIECQTPFRQSYEVVGYCSPECHDEACHTRDGLQDAVDETQDLIDDHVAILEDKQAHLEELRAEIEDMEEDAEDLLRDHRDACQRLTDFDAEHALEADFQECSKRIAALMTKRD